MSNKTPPFDKLFKLLMIGDSVVGKTCLIVRYASDQFSTTTILTCGFDSKTKYIEMDGATIKLQIWDTAGQERFRTITASFFRSSQGIMLVYDVTDRGSFTAVRGWMKQIELHVDVNVSKILIGNKCDLEKERLVRYEEGQALANEFNVPFFETSAKEDVNVKEAFFTLAKLVKERMPNTADGTGETRKIDSIRLTAEKPKPEASRCSC